MQKIRVIMYNNVGDYPPAAMEDGMPPAAFARDMAYLGQKGYLVLPLANALDLAMRTKPLPEKALCLTFDGGYLDAYTTVLPVLHAHQFPAAFFISPAHIGHHLTIGGVDIPCMTWEQVEQLASAGFTIGAYLLAGRIYKPEMEAELIEDIRSSLAQLRQRLHQPMHYVSLREGVPGPNVRHVLEEEDVQALFTKCPTKRRPHRYCIGRIQIDDDDPNIFRFKISANYLRFKDSRSLPYMRKFKLDRLAHRVSDAVNARRNRS